jgi:hypothetical protein
MLKEREMKSEKRVKKFKVLLGEYIAAINNYHAYLDRDTEVQFHAAESALIAFVEKLAEKPKMKLVYNGNEYKNVEATMLAIIADHPELGDDALVDFFEQNVEEK